MLRRIDFANVARSIAANVLMPVGIVCALLGGLGLVASMIGRAAAIDKTAQVHPRAIVKFCEHGGIYTFKQINEAEQRMRSTGCEEIGVRSIGDGWFLLYGVRFYIGEEDAGK